jgi:RNA polymerase sigma-70 factor (ECF subfamily)
MSFIAHTARLADLLDEAALVRAVAAGEPTAFERLYARYERRVFRYVLTFIRDRSVAEELVVDTLFAVWRGADKFAGDSQVCTWILGIARHKALDAARRVARQPAKVEIEAAQDIGDEADRPDQATQRRSDAKFVQQALTSLTADHREALHLAFFEEMPYEDIAKVLGIPPSTVKTRVYYAKLKLKEQLQRLTPQECLQ